MKLDEDLKDNLRSYINNIIADYSEKDFDIEKFLQFLFALYEQSDSLDDFSDLCQKELTDFFADNTENFVNDVMTHLNMNLETFNEVDRRNSRVSNDNNKNDADSISQPPSERADDDNEASDDDLLNDDDDEESDMNYKRRKMKSPSDTDEQPQKSEPPSAPKQHSHHRQHNTEHNKKENNHKYQKNPQQHNKNKPFPQGPPPQMPSGMMPQPNMPNMPNMPPQMMPPGGKAPPMMPDQKWPWPNPYSYMYPMGYMPNMPNMPTMPNMPNMSTMPNMPNMPNMQGGYPPQVYPDPTMGMMYPPPQYMMPEGKPSDYDPLHPEIKNPNKMDVKPPSSKPPENQHARKHQPRRDEQAEAPQPSKIHIGDKDGKKTPRTAPQQQRQQPQSRDKPVHGHGGHGPRDSAPSAAEGGNPKTTVYVKNIPDYYNNLDALNKQLKKFGPIVNIKVDLKTKSAMIEFVKPKHARTALSSKAPLFGNKEILLSGDMEAMSEDTNKEAKFEGQLLEKLKFLIEIKKYTSEEGKKMIVQKITDIKQAQKTKEIPDNLKKLLEYPIFDANTDFSQVIENVPDQYIAEKNKLSNKLETYGKLENFKLNPKTKTLEFKFYNLENASKAQQALATEFQIKYVNDKVHEIVDKITDFEQNYLSAAHDDHPL